MFGVSVRGSLSLVAFCVILAFSSHFPPLFVRCKKWSGTANIRDFAHLSLLLWPYLQKLMLFCHSYHNTPPSLNFAFSQRLILIGPFSLHSLSLLCDEKLGCRSGRSLSTSTGIRERCVESRIDVFLVEKADHVLQNLLSAERRQTNTFSSRHLPLSLFTLFGPF